MRNLILFGIAAALVACSSNKDVPDPGEGGGGSGAGGANTGGGGEGGGSDTLAIRWQPCPLITDGTGTEAECATIEVPLDWQTPQGRRIELFVKRKQATAGPPRGQIWMLAGGPGQPGSDFEALVQLLSPLDPTLSFYMLDHRGVGRSTRLGCPAQEATDSAGGYAITGAEWPACLQHIAESFSAEELAFFSTAQAAHDVGQLIEATRSPETSIAVWGGSYGSHWGNRYLQLYPEQPSQVILSAVATHSKLSAIDVWMDNVGRSYLDACDADLCQEKFGGTFGDSTQNVAEATMSGAANSFCAPIAALGWTPANMKPLLGQFMYSWNNRTLVPPIIYRLARCDAADVNALTELAIAVSAPPPDPLPAQQRLWGAVLGPHIIMSEMWDDSSTQAGLQAIADDAVVIHSAPGALISLYDSWPRYAAPQEALAISDVRVTMFHGALDFIGSDVYQPTVDHFQSLRPDNDFTLLPRATHGLQSPMGNGGQCGLNMLWAQLQDPQAMPASCVEDIIPLSFLPTPTLASQLLGTPDAWEGDPGASNAQLQASTLSPGLTTALLRYQRLHPAGVEALRIAKPK